MALPDLILPQATDNVIQSADIALVGGVAVSVPAYMDAQLGDLICAVWGDIRRAASVITDVNEAFPVVFLIPDDLTAIGQHRVSYYMIDNAGNVASSDIVTVTIE
ncbi:MULTISPECIES: hypothetical protein [Enterobacteriaceae]|uniref:hypothetical protein n=1 Tax=Enterobacteriaceae TaxID=543 RepID=UPI00119D2C03|nr:MULTISPECIES: hypothetical protein [Enterobacteriaceae]